MITLMASPLQSYICSLDSSLSLASYSSIKEMPSDLVASIRYFWSCYNNLVPAENRSFSHLGGIRNNLNFEDKDMKAFFVDPSNDIWVKVHHKVDEVTAWYSLKDALELDKIQFVFKVFYLGLAYQNPVLAVCQGYVRCI